MDNRASRKARRRNAIANQDLTTDVVFKLMSGELTLLDISYVAPNVPPIKFLVRSRKNLKNIMKHVLQQSF